MKRLLTTLSMLIGIVLSVSAQEGLRINEVFEGNVIPLQESLIKGESLEPFKLRVLHTGKFTVGSSLRDKVEALFKEDMKGRLSDGNDNLELEYRDGHLYYAIVQLADTKKDLHRYICYQCRDRSSHYDITLVYMEGKATLADLRKTFKKK